MADPLTLTIIGMTAAAVGGGVTAYGQYQSGQAQSSMYNYQSGVAKINQQLKKQDAEYARDVGEVEAQQAGMRTRGAVGSTRAAQGARGIDVNTGSAADIRKSQIDLGQQDERIIRSNAARRAYGFEVEGMNQGVQANIYGMAAKDASSAGMIKSAGTLISTAGTVASKWYQMGPSFGATGSGMLVDDPTFGGFSASGTNAASVKF